MSEHNDNIVKSFDILVTSLNILYNYFDNHSTKLFSNLYLTKYFLNTSTKLFFLYLT